VFKVKAALDFRTNRTFVHYKFSPLIRLSYAEFRLPYISDEQTFSSKRTVSLKNRIPHHFVSTKWQKPWRFGHTESGLPRRAAICARGEKAFELYYARLHHPRQTESGLTRWTSLDSGGQRTFVFWRQICQAGSTEWRKNSLKN